MCSIKKAQKERENFLYTLLEYDSSQKEFNPQFFKDEMLKVLNIDEGKFNKIQKSLGDQYCSYVDCLQGKNRYKIHTSNCWRLHDKFEDWELNNSLKTLTISLMILATFTLLVALPSAFVSYLDLQDKIQALVSEPPTNYSGKEIQKKEEQKASNSRTNETKPDKPKGIEKPIPKNEK